MPKHHIKIKWKSINHRNCQAKSDDIETSWRVMKQHSGSEQLPENIVAKA